MEEGSPPEGGVVRLFTSVLDNLLDSPSSALRWLMQRRGRQGLSVGLARVLAAASEPMLSTHLTLLERRAVLQTIHDRLQRASAAERRAICAHLDLLDRLIPLLGRFGSRFEDLSPEARRKCLRACERSRWSVLSEGQAKLRHLVQMGFMECSAVWTKAAA